MKKFRLVQDGNGFYVVQEKLSTFGPWENVWAHYSNFPDNDGQSGRFSSKENALHFFESCKQTRDTELRGKIFKTLETE